MQRSSWRWRCSRRNRSASGGSGGTSGSQQQQWQGAALAHQLPCHCLRGSSGFPCAACRTRQRNSQLLGHSSPKQGSRAARSSSRAHSRLQQPAQPPAKLTTAAAPSGRQQQQQATALRSGCLKSGGHCAMHQPYSPQFLILAGQHCPCQACSPNRFDTKKTESCPAAPGASKISWSRRPTSSHIL